MIISQDNAEDRAHQFYKCLLILALNISMLQLDVSGTDFEWKLKGTGKNGQKDWNLVPNR